MSTKNHTMSGKTTSKARGRGGTKSAGVSECGEENEKNNERDKKKESHREKGG